MRSHLRSTALLLALLAPVAATAQRSEGLWYVRNDDAGVRSFIEHAWLEDARAFRDKLALVEGHKLRGYSVWLPGLEDPRTWDVVGPARR